MNDSGGPAGRTRTRRRCSRGACRPPPAAPRRRGAERQRGTRPGHDSGAGGRLPRARCAGRSTSTPTPTTTAPSSPSPGEPLALQDALVALAGESIDRIDLRRHRGAHPRVGALDVVPVVALDDEDIPLAREIATGLASACGRAQPARLPLRRHRDRPGPRRAARLPRRGLEELERAIDEGRLVPDCGPHRLHPTAGAVLVGVRPPLIALNVWLPDGTLTEARTIAARVREAGGGLRGVRALGLYLPEAGMAQVSMNLEDYRVTPPAVAIAAVRDEAERLGVEAGDGGAGRPRPARRPCAGPSPSAHGHPRVPPRARCSTCSSPGWPGAPRPPDGQAQAPQGGGPAAGPQPPARGARRPGRAGEPKAKRRQGEPVQPRACGPSRSARGSWPRSSTPT